MKKAKRSIIIATVLVFVCAAVYLNWSYNNRRDDTAGVMNTDEEQQTAQDTQADDDYFAQARLTRQTSRDEALTLLETAASGEGASQDTIDSAMDAIAAMATWSMQETQIENLLLAKNFTDCVVYISSDGGDGSRAGPGGGPVRCQRGADNGDHNRRDRLHGRGHTCDRGEVRREQRGKPQRSSQRRALGLRRRRRHGRYR